MGCLTQAGGAPRCPVGIPAQQQSQLLPDTAREEKHELYAVVCAACLGQLTQKRITATSLGCICDEFNL